MTFLHGQFEAPMAKNDFIIFLGFILFITFTTHSAAEEFIEAANFDTFQCISGFRINSGSIIHTFHGESILKCVRLCLENQCSLLNWFEASSVCELRGLSNTYTLESDLCGMSLTADLTATVFLNVSDAHI